MRQLVLPRTQPVADLALSPDGRTLAVAHRNYGVLLYDPFDGRVKLEARGYFTRVTFREDGRWLAAMGGWAALVNMGESAPSILYPSNPAPTLAYGAHFDADDRVTFLTDNIKTHRLPPVNRATEGLVLEEEQEYAAVAYSRHRLGWGVGPKRQVVGLEYGLRAYRGVVFDLATGAVIALVEMPYARETFFRSRADWFAVTTPSELAIYGWSDVPALVPPVRQPRRRGLIQRVRETLLGPTEDTLADQRYGHLPTLRPRHRLLAIGTPPVDPLPVAFLPNGEAFLCRGAQSAIELRDTATGTVRASWQFQRAWPRVLAVAPDGLTAMAAMRGGTVVFWDLE